MPNTKSKKRYSVCSLFVLFSLSPICVMIFWLGRVSCPPVSALLACDDELQELLIIPTIVCDLLPLPQTNMMNTSHYTIVGSLGGRYVLCIVTRRRIVGIKFGAHRKVRTLCLDDWWLDDSRIMVVIAKKGKGWFVHLRIHSIASPTSWIVPPWHTYHTVTPPTGGTHRQHFQSYGTSIMWGNAKYCMFNW